MSLTDLELEALLANERGEFEHAEKLCAELDAAKPRASMGAAAAWWASVGQPVFPLVPRGKQPLTKHGFKDASVDLDQIRRWWTETPDANIGTPTGILFDAVDFDGPAGLRSKLDNPKRFETLQILAKVATPRGSHLYVPVSGHGNKAGLMPGVDYRGQGGYVVAPPSVTDVNSYVFLARPVFQGGKLVPIDALGVCERCQSEVRVIGLSAGICASCELPNV